jgi:hypothetical protein
MKSKNMIIMIVVVLSFLSGQLNAEEVVGKSIFPNIETPYIYPEAVKDKTLVWSTTIKRPRAAWIKIHFSKFRLNPDDYVDLVDRNGKVVERIRGKDVAGESPSKFNVKNDGDKTFSFWGPAIDGNKVTVELHSKPIREKGVRYRGDKAGLEGNERTAELHPTSNTKEDLGFIIDEAGIGRRPILEKAMEPIINENEKIDMSVFPFWKNNPRMSRMGYRGNPVDIVSIPIGKMLYRKNTTWYTCKGSLNSRIGNLFYPSENCLDSRDILDTLEVRFFLEYTTKKNVKNIPGYYTYYSDSVVDGESNPFITQIRLRNDNKMFSLDRKIGTQIGNNEDMLSGIYEVATDYKIVNEGKYAIWEAENFVPPLEETTSLDDTVVKIFITALDENDNMYTAEMWMNEDGNIALKDYNPSSSQSVSVNGISRTNAGPWWPLCCCIQNTICNISKCIFKWINIDCQGCVSKCNNNSVNNPCHSCDPWGLIWILCRWFGRC